MSTFTPTSGTNKLTPGQTYDLVTDANASLPGGIQLIGATDPSQPAAILNCKPGSRGHSLYMHNDGLTVKGIKFVGGGFFLGRDGNRNADIVFDNNEFEINVPANLEHRQGINWSSGLKNSKIINNRFKLILGHYCLYGYNYTGLTIANNELDSGGAHIDCQGGGDGFLVEQNYLVNCAGIGFEFQSQNAPNVTNVIVQDNWFENPDVAHADKSTMAYSLPIDKGHGTIVRRNYAQSPNVPDPDFAAGHYVRIMYELGGFDLQAYDNYSFGGNQCVLVSGTNATGSVKNNHLEGFRQGLGQVNHAAAILDNNGPQVVLAWLSRGRPHRNQRIGSTPTPTFPPPTILQGPAVGTTFAPGQQVTANGLGQNLRWEVDRTNDAQPEIALDTGNSIHFIVPADSTAQHAIRIRLYGDGGMIERTYAIVVPVQPPVDPTIAQMQARIDDLTAKLSTANADKASLQQQIDALKARIAQIHAETAL